MEDETMTFSEWENGQSKDISPSENVEADGFDSPISFDQYQIDQMEEQYNQEQEALEQQARKAALDNIANITNTGWFGKQAINVLGSAASLYKGIKYDFMDTIVKTFDDYTGNNLDREGEKAITDSLRSIMPGLPGGVDQFIDRNVIEEVEKFGQAARTDFGTIVDEETGEAVAKDYTHLAQEGDYGNAAKAFTEDLFGALPSIGAAFLPGGAFALGLSAVGSKSAEIIDENQDDSMGSIWGAATVTGAGEFATEMVTSMIGKGMFKVFGKAGAKGVKGVFNNIANTALAAGGEGLSEGLADTIERAADDYILGREDAWDGAGRSFVRNSLVGAVMGGTVNMAVPSPQRTMVIKQTQPNQISNAQKQAAVEIMDLENAAENATSEEAREIINKQIKEKKQVLADSNKMVENQFANMSDEQLKELTQVSADISMYEDMLNDENYDDSSKAIFQQEISKLKQKQEELFVNPEYTDIKRKDPVSARSIKLSKEVQDLYETEANPTVIADKLGGLAGNIATRKWSLVAPDLQKGTYQDFLSGLKYGKGGILDLIKTYDPQKNDSLAAYVGSLLDKRGDRIIKQYTKQKADKDITQARGIMAEDSGPTSAELADRLTIPQSAIEKAATNAELFNLKLDKISNIKDYVKQQKDFFKTYLTPEIKSFLKPKGSQLEKQKALKNYVYKNVDTLKELYMAAPGLNKVRSGPIATWSITPPTNKEFADYIMGEDLDLSTAKGRNALNSRKDKVAERIADSLGQKAWQEFVGSNQEAQANINNLSKQIIEESADRMYSPMEIGERIRSANTFAKMVKPIADNIVKNKGYDNDAFNEFVEKAMLPNYAVQFAKDMYDKGDLVGKTYGGIIYEDASKAFLRAAGIDVLEVQSGGFDSTVPDLQVRVADGRILNVEYKSSKGDRLGQFTVKIEDGNVRYVENREDVDIDNYPGGKVIDQFIKERLNSNSFKQVLDKINEIEGRTIKPEKPGKPKANEKITGIPFGTKIQPETWQQILKLPAYRDLVGEVEIPVDAVIDHYTSKGPDKSSFLIQIGDSGLYHFKEPIKGIPSKKFDGNVVARFRLKPGGSTSKAASFSYTAELGIKGKFEKSDFTLDNKENVADFKAALDNITPDDKLSFQIKRQEALEGLRDKKEKQLNQALANKFNEIKDAAITNEDTARTLTAMLENAWGGTVETSTNRITAMQKLMDQGYSKAEAKQVVDRVNGFQTGNFVYINRTDANLDTPFHEFGHVWNKVVYSKSPRVFNAIFEKVKNEAPELYAEQVKRIKDSGYKFDENSFEFKDEVVAGVSGLNGAKVFKEVNQQQSWNDLLKQYWQILKDFLGITKMPDNKSLQDMTVEEVLDTMTAEVLSGKPGSRLSKLNPKSWLKSRIAKADPAFSVSQDKQFKGLQALKNEYRKSKDLQKAIQAGYDVVKDSYSLETWTDFVEQAVKEVDVNNSKTLYTAKGTWLASNEISLDNIKEAKELEFTEELNRKARNLIYSSKGKGKPTKWFIPPNAEDFRGLLYTLFPDGEAGKEAKEFYTKYILDPYHRGVQNANSEVVNKLKAIKEIISDLNVNEDIDGTPYTIGTAVKAYNWVRNGQDPLPNSKSSQKQAIIDRMIATVESNPRLVELADFLNENVDIKYSDRMLTESLGQTILTEVQKGVRTKNLETFSKNVDAIFDQTNLDQLEKQFGKKYVQSLRGTIKRMKTGRNRAGLDAQSNVFAKWLGRSVGSTMFVNRRSALLQTTSFINFIGKDNNNLFQATRAYASPEANAIFKKLWTSDYLVNRRTGAKFDVLADEIAGEENIIDKILNAGFWPTKMADSLAIAFGGTPFYINTRDALIKAGMSKKEAEAEALQQWIDAAEEVQQSSDPSKISEIQASTVGKIIYAFANTPFQYARYAKRKMQDITSGRSENIKRDVGSIFYYTVAQAAMFNALQSGLLALLMFGDEDDEEKIDELQLQAVERSLTGFAKSLGNPGAITAATYSVLKEAMQERTSGEKIALAATEISPPLNSKLRDLNSAYWAGKYDDYVGMAGKVGSFVGVPLDNMIAITNSFVGLFDDQLDVWQKIMLQLGYNEYEIAPDVAKAKRNQKKVKKDEWSDDDWADDKWSDDDWADDEWDTPVKKLERGVAGVANRDGSIEVDPNLSPVEREKTIAHEKQHVKDIDAGRLDYDDDYVYWNGSKHKRENGNIIYNGKAYIEGHKDLPWEKKAYAAEPSTQEIKKRKKLY